MNIGNDYERVCTILTGITQFFSQIEQDYAISVSVHTSNRYLDIFSSVLGKYLNHSIPYCEYMKSKPELHMKCSNCQRMVTASFGNRRFKPYFGMCCFGVAEYVLPIISEDIPVGFISVTGYTSDYAESRRRAERKFERYGVNPDGYDEVLATLRTELPAPELLSGLLTPSAQLIGMLCVRTNRTKLHNYCYSAILSYIDRHYSETVSVSDMSEFLHCSKSYINHLFKRRNGKSVSAYVAEVRIAHAKKLLRTTDMSVRDVALEVGFNDTNYFSGIFKRLTDCTPTAYRKGHRR